jgi:hypothetical protein
MHCGQVENFICTNEFFGIIRFGFGPYGWKLEIRRGIQSRLQEAGRRRKTERKISRHTDVYPVFMFEQKKGARRD